MGCNLVLVGPFFLFLELNVVGSHIFNPGSGNSTSELTHPTVLNMVALVGSQLKILSFCGV